MMNAGPAQRAASLVKLCAFLLAGSAMPALAADVTGKVRDPKTGDGLPGATVRLGDRVVSADGEGNFTIRDVPAGPVELTIDYVGYPTATRAAVASDTPEPKDFNLDPPIAESSGSDIVVTGSRSAERRALQTKRASNIIQETLTANDVGKLPDQNVAEAVRRLPGLSVADDQGEGRYVVIRGGDPDLTNVTINGQTAAAPEPEGRQVKLDDIPSSLIGSVTVAKTLTADRDANAISGQVDINTLTAYDRTKNFLYARAAYGVSELNGKNPYEGDLTLGGKFGADRQFGVVLSGNYSKRPIESENLQYGPRVGIIPNDYRLRDYNLTRERYGVVGNFDFRPSPEVQLFVRTLYSVFTDHEIRDQFRIEIPTAVAVGTGAGYTPTGSGEGTFQRARGTRFVRSRDEDDNTFTVQAGGKFLIGQGELTAEGTYSKALKKDPLRSEFQFRSGTGLNTAAIGTQGIYGSYSGINTSFPVFDPTASAFNPALYPSRQVNYDRRRAEEKLYQGRVDFKLPITALGSDTYIKIGGKYLERNKTNDRTVDTYALSGFTLGVAASNDDLFTYNGRYHFGPRVLYDLAQAYVTANPASAVRDVNGSLSSSLVADYTANEKIYAGYVMGSFTFDRLTLVPGIRIEATDGRYSAPTITAPGVRGPDAIVTNSYTDVFPGLNARFDVTRKLVLRGAVTTAIGRPNYENLAPTIQVDPGAATVVLGNPLLKPYRALNGDVSFEYYLPGQGIISVAGFYKSIDNPIFSQQQVGVTGTFGGVAVTNATITQPINADHQVIYGVEGNLQTQFTFLPGFWSGFGIGVNYARIDGKATGVPNRVGPTPPFFQSKDVLTAQLFYERSGITARVAYSYRSAYLEAIGGNPALDTYVADHGQLDVRGSYAIIPQVTLFMEATNLTDSPLRRYLGNPSQVIENERYSFSVRGGVQLAF